MLQLTLYGFKTATKQEDGSFIFSARSNEGTESGVKDEALKRSNRCDSKLTFWRRCWFLW